MKLRPHVRTIWISDLHLGSAGCKAGALLQFLKSLDCDYLYLVGDILDLQHMRGRVVWNADCTGVVRRILGMARAGARVVYVIGNHDDALRRMLPLELEGGIEFCDEYCHVRPNGDRWLVIHGDRFDFVVGHMKWLTILGSWIYDRLLEANSLLHGIRTRLGRKDYWSLSAYLKRRTKQAISFMHDFRKAATGYAAGKGYTGVVCGHIHTAAVDACNGIVYLNCGDAVESGTAIIEQPNGTIELRRYL